MNTVKFLLLATALAALTGQELLNWYKLPLLLIALGAGITLTVLDWRTR